MPVSPFFSGGLVLSKDVLSATGAGGFADQNIFFTGGLNTKNADLQWDPFITGYSFIKWISLPAWFTEVFPNFADHTERNFKALQGLSAYEINPVEITHGFTGNAYPVAGGVTRGNVEFTLRHQELQGNPVTNAYEYWTSGIRDPRTGVASYTNGGKASHYGARFHTAELLYIQTTPDPLNPNVENVIEWAAYLTAVWPRRTHLDHRNFEVGQHDAVEIEQTFSCQLHTGPKVIAFARDQFPNFALRTNWAGNAEYDPISTDSRPSV